MMRASKTSGRVLRRAASEGVLAALWRIARARRLAPGRGEFKAVRIDGGSAMVRVRVKVNGERNLMVRERRGEGSCVVVLRISVRIGRTVGRRGGMLDSERLCD
jgi:hypothetical protein